MSIFSMFGSKKNGNKKNEQLTIEEKWKIDCESYKNENYKADIKEGQCYRCANRIKGNVLKCSKFDVIPKEIMYGKKKCKSREEI